MTVFSLVFIMSEDYYRSPRFFRNGTPIHDGDVMGIQGRSIDVVALIIEGLLDLVN